MTPTATEEAAALGQFQQGPATFGYYRQPDGWITASPAGELDELKYSREGWELLPYGRVEMASGYAASNPLEGLFLRGGAKELCREQIINSALHLTPPLLPSCGQVLNQHHKRHHGPCWVGAEPVSFPQLEDVPDGLACRFCPRPPFPTEEARDQHEGVMHNDEKSDIRTGKILAESLVEGLKGGGAINIPTSPAKPYVCGLCTAGFNSHVVLAKHVKDEHKEGANGTGNQVESSTETPVATASAEAEGAGA